MLSKIRDDYKNLASAHFDKMDDNGTETALARKFVEDNFTLVLIVSSLLSVLVQAGVIFALAALFIPGSVTFLGAVGISFALFVLSTLLMRFANGLSD